MLLQFFVYFLELFHFLNETFLQKVKYLQENIFNLQQLKINDILNFFLIYTIQK